MSKGNFVVTFRIDTNTLIEIQRLVESRNKVTKSAPWTRTDFMLKAIAEKIAHAKRSRGRKKKRSDGKTGF